MDPQLKLIMDELKTLTASVTDLKLSVEDRIDGVERSLGDRFSVLEGAAVNLGTGSPELSLSWRICAWRWALSARR